MDKTKAKKIAVIGSGIVGQATGKGLVKVGHDVLFYDKNPVIVSSLKKEGYWADNIENITIDPQPDGKEIETFMISVPTPTKNGHVELMFLKDALGMLGKALKKASKKPVFVIRSTVPPGTTENLAVSILEQASGKKYPKDFGVCMNPEFLREVSAEKDFSNPWMVVIGSNDKSAGLLLEEIYKKFNCPVVHMSLKEAEMMKYAHNLLNATKISFFNEMRLVSDVVGADPEIFFPVVVKSAEAMWNPEYGIKNFGPYGGVCLPKDTEAFFTWVLETTNFEMPVLKGTMKTNRIMQEIVSSNQLIKNLEQEIELETYHIMPMLEKKFLPKEFSKKQKIKSKSRDSAMQTLPL